MNWLLQNFFFCFYIEKKIPIYTEGLFSFVQESASGMKMCCSPGHNANQFDLLYRL